MKNFNYKHTRLFLICSLTLFGVFSTWGCFEYPEGPVFTIITKYDRFSGIWKVDNVSYNGVSLPIYNILDSANYKIFNDSTQCDSAFRDPNGRIDSTHCKAVRQDTIYNVSPIYGDSLVRLRTFVVTVSRNTDNNTITFYENGLRTNVATYTFARYGDYLSVQYVSSNGVPTDQVFWNVLKLTEKDFVYVDENGIRWEMSKL